MARDLMRLRNLLLQTCVLVLLLSIASAPAFAQFGEVAGQLYTNVSIGGSNSITFTLVNGGSYPIKFQIITPPQFQTSTPNTVAPTVTTNPMSGTIAPSSEFTINVIVHVPSAKNNTPGTKWIGIIQAVVVSNSSAISGSGANIQEGVAKTLTITAAEPSASILPYVIGVIVVAVVAIGVYLGKFRKRAKKGAAGTARKTRKPTKKQVRRARRVARKRTSAARRRRPSARARARRRK